MCFLAAIALCLFAAKFAKLIYNALANLSFQQKVWQSLQQWPLTW